MTPPPCRMDPHRALQRALAATFGGTVDGLVEERWFSATFEGCLHRMRIVLPDRPDLIAVIGEIEFVLPGHFVAEIAVTDRLDGDDGLAFTIEALTIAND